MVQQVGVQVFDQKEVEGFRRQVENQLEEGSYVGKGKGNFFYVQNYRNNDDNDDNNFYLISIKICFKCIRFVGIYYFV